MLKSSATHPTTPDTVWLARGRHTGPAPVDDVRRNLVRLREAAVVDAFLEPEGDVLPAPVDHDRLELPGQRHHPWQSRNPQDTGHEVQDTVFEARWRVAGEVTVRARLTLHPIDGLGGADWVLVAEAERRWDPRWPSPAEVFWPTQDDASWDRSPVAALRTHAVNPLPRDDDKVLRRLLKDCAHDGWNIHVVVHEAMTPDERGRLPLTRLLEPSLRDRVVEHRATPDQWRAVDYALKEHGVRLPRGGAVILPGEPVPSWYTEQDFTVRTVFLDGSEPTELTGALRRFAALPRPLPRGGEEALTTLREQWHLMTLQERLERAESLVGMYAAALETMTRSRDLYREAAERADEALRDLRKSVGKEAHRVAADAGGTAEQGTGFSLRQLTRTLERVRANRTARPKGTDKDSDPGTGAGTGPATNTGTGTATGLTGIPEPPERHP